MEQLTFHRVCEKQLTEDSNTSAQLDVRGASSLSTAQLVALVTSQRATPTHNDFLCAIELLKEGGLRRLNGDPAHYGKLTPISRRRLQAALELAKRLTEEDIRLAETLTGAMEAYQFLRPRLRDLEHEAFSVIFLNQKHGVIAYKEMFKGTISASSVHPREIVKAALKENAAAVILAHNHPSGHVSPSPDDLRLTEDLKKALGYIDVRVVDHIILGGNTYFSFAREGLLC